jgi:hypothetical protein
MGSWLFGESLKKNRSAGLPRSFKLFSYTLDGVDDFISINNSNVLGNPYDFDRTNAFTLAQIVTPRVASLSNFAMWDKRSTSAGYFWGVNSSSQMFASFNTPSGQRGALINSGIGFGKDVKTIWIISFSGNSDATGFTLRQYNGNTGNLIQTASISGGGASILGGVTGVMTGDLRNTSYINIGKNFVGGGFTKADIQHPSIWNVEFNGTQAQELASKIINDTVKSHSVYSSNCVGYWKNAVEQTLLNEINNTYNGILSGFKL